jgi:hypothetical protein
MKCTSNRKKTSFATNTGVTKQRTLVGSGKSGIVKMGCPCPLALEVVVAETFEAAVFISHSGHQFSLTQKSSTSRKG